jgi:hypothetical protein
MVRSNLTVVLIGVSYVALKEFDITSILFKFDQLGHMDRVVSRVRFTIMFFVQLWWRKCATCRSVRVHTYTPLLPLYTCLFIPQVYGASGKSRYEEEGSGAHCIGSAQGNTYSTLSWGK